MEAIITYLRNIGSNSLDLQRSEEEMNNGGRSKCKYYKACGNHENCKNCDSFEKAKITPPSCLTNPERYEELLERYKE